MKWQMILLAAFMGLWMAPLDLQADGQTETQVTKRVFFLFRRRIESVKTSTIQTVFFYAPGGAVGDVQIEPGPGAALAGGGDPDKWLARGTTTAIGDSVLSFEVDFWLTGGPTGETARFAGVPGVNDGLGTQSAVQRFGSGPVAALVTVLAGAGIPVGAAGTNTVRARTTTNFAVPTPLLHSPFDDHTFP